MYSTYTESSAESGNRSQNLQTCSYNLQ